MHADVSTSNVNLQQLLKTLLLCEKTRALVRSGAGHAITATAYYTSDVTILRQALTCKRVLEENPCG